jgi:hypothetical protein
MSFMKNAVPSTVPRTMSAAVLAAVRPWMELDIPLSQYGDPVPFRPMKTRTSVDAFQQRIIHLVKVRKEMQVVTKP